MSIQRVIDDNGGSAAINSSRALIADLSLYPGGPRKPGNPVEAASLAVVEQAVVKLAVAINLAAFLLGFPKKTDLPVVFTSPLAQVCPEPSVKAAGMNTQQAAHRSHRKQILMLGNERVLHFAFLAKYAVAFLYVALLGDAHQFLLSCLISSAWLLPWSPVGEENFFFHS